MLIFTFCLRHHAQLASQEKVFVIEKFSRKLNIMYFAIFRNLSFFFFYIEN